MKQHSKTLWSLLTLLIVASMVLAGCGGSATPAAPAAEAPAAAPAATMTTIKVGTNAEYQPFEFIGADGKITGFDVDLLNAAAAAGGLGVDLVNTKWDGIFVALASGEFDAVISAVTITPERAEVVDFTDAYFNAGQAIAVRADNTDINSEADLDGKSVGVQIGTTGDIYLTDNTKANVQRFEENPLALQALANKDVDAVVADSPTLADSIKANPELGLKMVGEPFTEELYGIAVNKGKPEVLAALNAGLAAIRADGTYDAIYATWFGASEAVAAAPAAPAMDLMSVSAPDCEYGGLFKSIEAIDDLTVKMTLCSPDVAFPSKVAFSSFAIQSSDYLEATGGSGDLVQAPIGTGPYMLDRWVNGDSIIFKKNPNYWGEPAANDTLIFRWSSEGAQRLLELQSGTVDGIDNPSPDDFATIEGDAALALYPREALNIFYVGMNDAHAPFDNEMVRQAIAIGIDRDRIVDNFYPAGSVVASHFTPCAIPGGCEGEDWYEFDPAAAKALLAEAGFPDGFETVINYRDVVRGYLPAPALVAQDIQAQLKANLNIDATIEVMESGAFLAASDAGQLTGLHLLGWGADYPDATNFLDFHFGAGASDQFGGGHPDIHEALKNGGALVDPAERNAFYTEANNLIKQHVPMIPIAHGGSATAFKAETVGAHASPLGNEHFASMSVPGQDSFVWMQNAEPIGLYCADETDGESLRACEQVNESLLAYEVAGTAIIPSLAEHFEANAELTEWTFHLRPGVTFHDGSALDANDVVLSYAVQWDASNPLHTGRIGTFTYWSGLFGSFLNAE